MGDQKILIDDLKEQIAKGQVIAIVGAGVSIGATKGAETASWLGLLRHGIERCEAVASPSKGWGDRQRAALDSGDLDELLAVASQIESKLGAPKGGEYRRWLRESVGQLTASDQSVLNALRELSIPVATTNYDSLLTSALDKPTVTWREGNKVQRVIRGDEPGIVHLHGYWEDSESVVLGFDSYNAVRTDAHAQAIQRALGTMCSFLFIGCGDTTDDPNFSPLLNWMERVFSGSEYRHFRLCLEKEKAAIQARHPSGQRVFALSYGADHKDLAPFLRSLRPAGYVARPTSLTTSIAPARLPQRPHCLGRDTEVEVLVQALLADEPPPIPVLGGPGIGKSTICLTALHDAMVAAKYGSRRYFVRLDSATSAEGMYKEIAQALGLPVGPNLAAQVLTELDRTPTALVLDNAETPWEGDTLKTEESLKQLAGVKGLGLLVGLRSNQSPYGVAWGAAIRLTPLDPTNSRKVFLAVTDDRHAADRRLNDLLTALDGVPLAITLLAYAAQAEPNLEGLWAQWRRERVDMLRREGQTARTANAAASFELSINGPRMDDSARRLLSLLGFLPDGIAHLDLPDVFPSDLDKSAARLRRVGLAFDDHDRLRVLAPIREHVSAHHRPDEAALAPAIDHYVGLAANLGAKIGWEGGAEAVQRLSPETGNIEACGIIGLEELEQRLVIQAAVAFGKLAQHVGLGTTKWLAAAEAVASQANEEFLKAECIYQLGEIALARTDHPNATVRFEEARRLYAQAQDICGEAKCIKSLGNIALRLCNHGAAAAHFEHARTLFSRVGDALGEADCVRGLGDIALSHSEYQTAKTHFEEALSLYAHSNNILGKANCTIRLGNAALECNDDIQAEARINEALHLFISIGDVLGEARCIQRLGEIKLYHREFESAETLLQSAQFLYVRMGNPLASAGCVFQLGNIARLSHAYEKAAMLFLEARRLYVESGSVAGEANCNLAESIVYRADGNSDNAKSQAETALELFNQIGDSYSIGLCHRELARLVCDGIVRAMHLTSAREAWTKIKRDDLLKELDEEFGLAA